MSLIQELAARVEDLGGLHERRPSSFGPDTIRVALSNERDFDTLAHTLSVAAALPVTVSRNFPLQLLRLLPRLSSLIAQLRSIPCPASQLARYDAASGSWKPGPPDRPGAYRVHTTPWQWGYMPTSLVPLRRILLGDARLVKFCAAMESGQSLIEYDARSGELSVPWGAQLPGLYERAAVLCSGEAPLRMVDGTVRYRDVLPAVASELERLLTT